MPQTGKQLAQCIIDQCPVEQAFVLVQVVDYEVSPQYRAVVVEPGSILGYDTQNQYMFVQDTQTGKPTSVFDFYGATKVEVQETSIAYSTASDLGTYVNVCVHASVESAVEQIVALATRAFNGLPVEVLIELLAAFLDDHGVFDVTAKIAQHHLNRQRSSIER